MNIIEHLSRTITPVLLNNVNDTNGNRASLLEKVYAIIVARLADDNVANEFATTNVVNDDVGFFDRFLPQLSHRNDMVHQLSTHYSVPEQEASSLISRAAPMVYNELRNLAGTTPLHTFLRNHISSLASVIPAWAYAFLPAGILTALNVNTSHAAPVKTQQVETTTTREHLVPVVEQKKGMSPLLPLIGLIILGALAWALMKGCQKDPAPVAKPTTTVTSTTSSTTRTTTVVASTPATTVVAPASVASATTVTTRVISETEPSVYFENGHLNFYFATGKADVAGDAKEKAKEILAAAKTGTILGISGYTDSTGNAAANEKLSKDRAQAVKAFLVANGVPESHLQLIKPTDTVGAAGKDQEGRRVEVYAVGKDGKEIALPTAVAVGTTVGNAVGTAVGTTANVAEKTATVMKDAATATANATKEVAKDTADATKVAAGAAANAADKAVTTTTTTTTNK